MTRPDPRAARGDLTRRDFLRSSAAAGLIAGAGLAGCATGAGPAGGAPAQARFGHGVASGDPLADRVVLWTRITPRDGAAGAEMVRWRVARDPLLLDVVTQGEVTTDADRDYTVKVDVAGLAPGTSYFYQFGALAETSPTGRTRTLPVGAVDRLRFAVCSCANYATGYFGAYAAIARRADLDAVLHLGDFIYEHGVDGPFAQLPGREAEPSHEAVSLADYRARYAQTRRDPDLQAMQRQHPLIAVWDDHEFANDAWRGGSENHDARSEGDWDARRRAAARAWREWMPVRVADPGSFDADPRLWRGFRFGDLVELLMLDTRLAGRDMQAPRTDRLLLEAPGRSLLGAEQEAWLLHALDEAKADAVPWRILGQQVVFAPWSRPPRPPNPDGWDGYPGARARIFDHLESGALRDVVVLSGDVHSSWALEVPRDPFSRRGGYDPATGAGSLAVEFVAPAISSPPLASFPGAAHRFGASLEELPHLRFLDLASQGYVLLDVDRDRTQAEWWFVDGVTERSAAERFAAAFATPRGRSRLVAVAAPSLPRADAAPLAPPA